MLNVSEAKNHLLASISEVGTETIPTPLVDGRILAVPVVSGLNLPPFSNSAMDGFAIQSADVANASSDTPVILQVTGDIPAGQVASGRVSTGKAMRIMTGAPLPEGADCVVPVEGTDFNSLEPGASLPAWVQVFQPIQRGAHLRLFGEDLKEGETVLLGGHRLRPQDIGLLATLGYQDITVYRRPVVAVISTGDELLPLGAPLEHGKIRESNSYTLAALAEACGSEAHRLGIVPDNEGAVQASLDKAVDLGTDLIISSAGVSVGAYDYVRSVVEAQGELQFWRVNMRPGKPLAFGHYRNIPFIGLPGNPVSAFVGFEVFIRSALWKMGGVPNWQRPVTRAVLGELIHSDGRESYLRGVMTVEDGVQIVRVTGHQGSGNLYSLVQANALFVVPAGVTSLPAGERVEVWPL